MSCPEVDLLLKPFWNDGCETIYSTECCNKIFVGKFSPKSCRACGAVDLLIEVHHRDSALDNG